MCGSFFLYLFMNQKTSYTKAYQNASALVQLLLSRGLQIDDTMKAELYLKTISYYRLSAYMHPLLSQPKSANHFKPGSTFQQVMKLYRFDKKLRLLVFNEIEKIEIAVRTAIIDECSVVFGTPFWMTDCSFYVDVSKFQKTLALIDVEMKKSREDFIVHFLETYTDAYPPAWILSEILPLGTITNIFTNLRNKQVKKRVAQRFGLQPPVFNSWMTVITLTRNCCCHHARMWNKRNTITPMPPRKLSNPWITLSTDSLRVYYDLCIIKYFLNIISPGNDMHGKLNSLLSQFPMVDIVAMGFPEQWETELLWQ